MLGKVFSLVGVVTQGLMPLGMALGGVLGQYFPLRAVMASAFLAELIVFMTIAFIPSFQRFMNANHAAPSVAG